MHLYKLAKLDDCDGDLGKRWLIYYSFKHPETGRMMRFRKYLSINLKTKSARYDKANEHIRTINNWLKQGGNPFQVTAQFTQMLQALDYVYDIKKASLRPRSYSSYNTVIKYFKLWLKKSNNNNISLDEFGFHQAQLFMDWIVVHKKPANRTYNNYITFMRIIFNTLIQREYIVVNPFLKVKLFPKTDAGIRNFTPDEMVLIRENLPYYNYGLWIACQFIYYCFIRPGELIRLKIADIDLDKKEIYIRPEVSKNRKGSTLPIPNNFINELQKMQLDKYSTGNFVFSVGLKPGRTELSHNALSRAWRVWAVKHGIKKDLYDFKHTGIGRALDNGININDLRMQLRHKSLETTQIYLEKFRAMPGEKLRNDFPEF